MCNCGNKRSAVTAQLSADSVSRESIQTAPQKTGPGTVFIYTGQSALTTTGSVTGKRYRFNGPGDKQLIDYRDAASMMSVPVLKRI
jgi:hypothetical protein